jgi:hypothetical protein
MQRGTHILASGAALALIAAGSAKAQLTVNGEVATPLTLSDASLGGTTVTATIGGNTYTGSSVYSLISNAWFENDPAQAKNGNLLDLITISGAGGQSAMLSEGQIDPGFGGQPGNPQDFIATSENGSAIAPLLIVQTDPNGLTDGYDISDVTNISVGWATVPSFSLSTLDDETSFTVTGDVNDSGAAYDTSNFSTIFPPATQTTQTDTFEAGAATDVDSFTGVPIFTLLQNAGLSIDPSNPAILDDYIVVTGSNEPTTGVDDYAVAYSLGEIDPAFNDLTSATVPLVADLGTSFRTTAPSDLKGGRYDSDLINIDFVPEPSSLLLLASALGPMLVLRRRHRHRHA